MKFLEYGQVKAAIDRLFALALLLATLPITVAISIMVFAFDLSFPFYMAERVSRGGGRFRMVKFRSMVINADKSNIFSTALGDTRITPVGKFIRRYKIDELPQLVNVLLGQMSFVGPRPNTMKHGVELYNDEEMRLLSVLPGITDLSSVIFSDEGEILRDSRDPDHDYNILIRPWKSRLSLWHIANRSFVLDALILFLTGLNVVNRRMTMIILDNVMRYFYQIRVFSPVIRRSLDIKELIGNVNRLPYY